MSRGGVREDSLAGRIQPAPSSWLDFVTSHSSWETSKTKSSKIKRWIIIVTDYQTWAGKLQFFLINRLLNFLFLILSNTNDDGNNNEKKTKNLKTRVGIFKNMCRNFLGGNFLGRNFLGRNFPGRSIMDGNFSGGNWMNEWMSEWITLFHVEKKIHVVSLDHIRKYMSN